MGATLTIDMDQEQTERFTAFLEGLNSRLIGPSARDKIIPILLEHLDKLVERERKILSPHNKSSALSDSLTARAGTGDYANKVSVFSAPTATSTVLQQTWGLKGALAQQKGWAKEIKAMKTRGRKRVFYGVMVHQGHAAPGDKGGPIVTEPIPFADEASEALGEEAAEAAGEDLLVLIAGEDNDNG